jgi:diadenylate cyclase
MFEIFKIGFLSINFLDLLDIAIVSFIFYKLYTAIRGTIAAQIFYGLVIVLVLTFLSQAANFKALGWLLKLLSDIWVIAFIILFQPEIRRLLVLVGKSHFLKPFIKTNATNVADIITDTAFELAQQQHGALMVIVKTAGIRGVVETGELLNSRINKSLLRTIFFPRTTLHDGAVIIRGDLIEAARCTLPLTPLTVQDGLPLGMRHRAGIGISEQADVIVVIVSEETGSISIAENGILKRGLSRDGLRSRLLNSIGSPKKANNKNNIFDKIFKKN